MQLKVAETLKSKNTVHVRSSAIHFMLWTSATASAYSAASKQATLKYEGGGGLKEDMSLLQKSNQCKDLFTI